MSIDITKLNKEGILRIKASCNIFYLGEEIELIALKESIYGIEEIKKVKWSIDYIGEDIKLNNNIIFINNSLKNIEKLGISCEDINTGEKSHREFSIKFEERKETLVHFIKNDGDYFGSGYKWDLWVFSKNGVSYDVPLDGDSDFGKCAFIQEENVIARRRAWGENWGNDWSEQSITFEIPKKTKNCYIVYGENRLITNIYEVIDYIKPRIEVAIMDTENSILAFLSRNPLEMTEFYIYINGIKNSDVKYYIDGNSKKVEFFDLNLNFLASDLIEIRASNTFLPCKVTLRKFLDKFNYEGNDMGVTYSEENINFKLWAPSAIDVDLCIFENWYDKKEKISYKMNYIKEYGIFNIKIDRKINENKFYLYKLYFKDIDRNGLQYIRVNYAVDPYSISVGINGEKGYLVDINSNKTMPYGWLLDQRPKLIKKEDSIIYELHLRDFTISKESGVDKKYRGKYLGLCKEGTNYRDSLTNISVSTGIDHLKELGITHIHILPIFDFGSVDERKSNKEGNRNWGYDPKNYNAPEGSYSSDAYCPITRIIELRKMIKTLHKNNIRVVMDVVYNHMYETRNFDNIVPGYYFRSNYRGRFTNGSGCGNEIATERPMVRKFIIDSIKHWIINYNIDGLRFDLMELIDLDTMKDIVNITESFNENIIVYGEPWKGGESAVINGTYRGSQRGSKFSIFNDNFRNYIRGNNTPSRGFVNGNPHDGPTAWSIIEGLKGSINTLTKEPGESINYVDAHDNYTLWDHIEKSLNFNIKEEEYRLIDEENIFDNHLVRRNILALSIVMLSQGIPFIQGGAELLRTKNGDHNSYKSPDNINAFYWSDKVKYLKVFNYVKNLIEIRKKFNEFRFEKREDVNKINISFLNGDEKVGVIKWHYKEQSGRELIVIFNATSIDNYNVNKYIDKPKNEEWLILAVNDLINPNGIKTVKYNEIPELRSFSILIMYANS